MAQFDYNSANSITMSALWPGDSGTVYWSIENNDDQNFILTIAQGPERYGQFRACNQLHASSIPRISSCTGPGPPPAEPFTDTLYDLVGRGTQTFMAGIKTLQMRYGSQVYAPL